MKLVFHMAAIMSVKFPHIYAINCSIELLFFFYLICTNFLFWYSFLLFLNIVLTVLARIIRQKFFRVCVCELSKCILLWKEKVKLALFNMTLFYRWKIPTAKSIRTNKEIYQNCVTQSHNTKSVTVLYAKKITGWNKTENYAAK